MKTRIERLFESGNQQVDLLWSSSDDRIDALLKGSVHVFESFFPGRIHGYYLVGSYADDTAVSTSDIDLHPVFRGGFASPNEEALVYQVRDTCNSIPSVDFNVDPWPQDFAQKVYSGLFPLVALPVYGEDIRDSIPCASLDAFTRFAVSVGGLLKCRRARTLRFPVEHPVPSEEFCGYDDRGTQSFKGETARGTKDLINVLYTVVRSRLAICEKQYITSKAKAFSRYGQLIKDDWTEYVEEVWRQCRTNWEYRIPESESDREKLRLICSRMPDLENHYLSIYRDFMLSQLGTRVPDWPYGDTDYTTYSLLRFGTVVYPNDSEIDEALSAYATSDNDSWRQAARSALERNRGHPIGREPGSDARIGQT